MTPNDIERLMARYRPAGPRPELRRRVLSSVGQRDRTSVGTWLSMSALAACSIFFVHSAAAVYSDLGSAARAAGERQRAEQFDAMVEELGGDALAREVATDAFGPGDAERVRPEDGR